MEIETATAKKVFSLLAKSTYKTDNYDLISFWNNWVTASNGVTQIEYMFPFDTELKTSVSPDTFKKSIASINDDSIKIEGVESVPGINDLIKIKARKTRLNINRISGETPLLFAEEKNLVFEDFDFFKDPMPLYFAMKGCSKFPADGNMNGVILYGKSMIATNGNAAIKIDFQNTNIEFNNVCIIPYETASLIAPIAPNKILIVDNTIIFQKENVFLDGDKIIFSSSMLDKEDYPLGGDEGIFNPLLNIFDSIRNLPEKNYISLTEDFLGAIKQSYIFANPEENKPVICSQRNGKIKIKTENEKGGFERELDQNKMGDGKEIFLKIGLIEIAFELSETMFLDFEENYIGFSSAKENSYSINLIISTKGAEKE